MIFSASAAIPSTLRDGEQQWFDLAARPVGAPVRTPRTASRAFGSYLLPRDVLS